MVSSYLADNAGELVFDRLLIERILEEWPELKIFVAVRGAPVSSDATLVDADDIELDAVATVLQNGSDAPGTLLSDCSAEFQELFERADMVISKGQGNYESLSGTGTNVCFLFTVKCDLVARQTGLRTGTLVAGRPPGGAGTPHGETAHS